MKTVIETSTNLSKYIFEDSDNITITAENIETPNFIIGDLNSSNCTIIEGVTPPEDWIGCKYFYIDSNWVINTEWETPEN